MGLFGGGDGGAERLRLTDRRLDVALRFLTPWLSLTLKNILLTFAYYGLGAIPRASTRAGNTYIVVRIEVLCISVHLPDVDAGVQVTVLQVLLGLGESPPGEAFLADSCKGQRINNEKREQSITHPLGVRPGERSL